MSSTVEQIKEKLDIVDVVGSYIKLEKAGGNFKARCPFHNEKTPSFFVSPSRGTYHCFGCNRGGDIFSFVEEMEGVDFIGALKILADRAGVEVRRYNKEYTTENQTLFALLEDAALFFEQQLRKNGDAIAYLKNRGVQGGTAKAFRIGYAPCGWNNLSDFLQRKGYSPQMLKLAGLTVCKSATRCYDRFRCRVMFPIFDSSGRVIAFSGRIIETRENRGEDLSKIAKYINSPETPLFHKSNVLYGFDRAKMEMRKKGYCVLVEGQMDVVLSHQAGFVNTVAVSGTALGKHHMDTLRRFTDTVILAFDADSAGFSAVRRAVDIALSVGLSVKIAIIPEGSDPADIILKSPHEWASILDNAKYVIDFYLDSVLAHEGDRRVRNIKIGTDVLPYVAKLKNKMEQAHFISEISSRASISEEVLWEQVTHIGSGDETPDQDSSHVNTSLVTGTRKELIERRILGLLFLVEEKDFWSIDIKDAKKKYRDIVGEVHSREMFALPVEKRSAYALEAELFYDGNDDLSGEFEELIRNLEEEVLKETLAAEMERLEEYERRGDNNSVGEILKRCQEISKKINELKHVQ